MNYMHHFENTTTLILKRMGTHKKHGQCKCPCPSETAAMHISRARRRRRIVYPAWASHRGLCQSCWPGTALPPSITHATVPPHPKSPPRDTCWDEAHPPKSSFLCKLQNKHLQPPPPPHAAGNTRVYVFGKRRRGMKERERENSFGKIPSSR